MLKRLRTTGIGDWNLGINSYRSGIDLMYYDYEKNLNAASHAVWKKDGSLMMILFHLQFDSLKLTSIKKTNIMSKWQV